MVVSRSVKSCQICRQGWVKVFGILDGARGSDVLRSSAHQVGRCFPCILSAGDGHNLSRACLESVGGVRHLGRLV